MPPSPQAEGADGAERLAAFKYGRHYWNPVDAQQVRGQHTIKQPLSKRFSSEQQPEGRA
jgi:hypothetical protein